MSEPYDPGLQGERTSLAWTRTALALALAGAVVARLTVERLGSIAVVISLAGVACAAAVALLAGARHRRTAASLHESGTVATDGRMLALAALSALTAGIGAALFVVWGMLDA